MMNVFIQKHALNEFVIVFCESGSKYNVSRFTKFSKIHYIYAGCMLIGDQYHTGDFVESDGTYQPTPCI